MKFVIVPITAIPTSKLRPLTIHRALYWSGMREQLHRIDRNSAKKPIIGIVCLVYDNDDIIGWGSAEIMIPTKFKGRTKHIDIMVFVHHLYRQQGIGKKILRRLKNYCNKWYNQIPIRVYPHSTAGHKLFKNLTEVT
jgi:GNAT superfamily N-acetyltransferase